MAHIQTHRFENHYTFYLQMHLSLLTLDHLRFVMDNHNNPHNYIHHHIHILGIHIHQNQNWNLDIGIHLHWNRHHQMDNCLNSLQFHHIVD